MKTIIEIIRRIARSGKVCKFASSHRTHTNIWQRDKSESNGGSVQKVASFMRASDLPALLTIIVIIIMIIIVDSSSAAENDRQVIHIIICAIRSARSYMLAIAVKRI